MLQAGVTWGTRCPESTVFPFILPFLLCECVHTGACACVCVNAHVSACGWRPGDNHRCSSGSAQSCCLSRGLPLFWNSPSKLGWLASQPQESTCLCLFSVSIIRLNYKCVSPCPALSLIWVSGKWPQFLMPTRQVLHELGYLPPYPRTDFS